MHTKHSPTNIQPINKMKQGNKAILNMLVSKGVI